MVSVHGFAKKKSRRGMRRRATYKGAKRVERRTKAKVGKQAENQEEEWKKRIRIGI